MKVIVYVKYQGKNVEWNKLSRREQDEIREKLNKQTAEQMGYEKITTIVGK